MGQKIKPMLIAHEMLALAGVKGKVTNLVRMPGEPTRWWCDGWEVDLPYEDDDLNLSLNDFSAKVCAPAIRTWKYARGRRAPMLGLPMGCVFAVQLAP